MAPKTSSRLNAIFFCMIFFLEDYSSSFANARLDYNYGYGNGNANANAQLDCNYYGQSCPRLQMIVKWGVWAALRNDTRMAASLLRLHFHDCFVNGCDASVLLDDTPNFTGEKNANPNIRSLRGFEVIDSIKADVERVCPSTVSCADIVALAATEAVSLAGGPLWDVPLGRRDGLTASQKAANEQIPSPFESLDSLLSKFTSNGLDKKDLVVLSGAHTLGFAQCFTFKRRLSDFKGTGKADPTLDPSLLSSLQSTCPDSASNNKLVPLDSDSETTFDNSYYRKLVANSGLLESDQALMGDPETAEMVRAYSMSPYLYSRDFGPSMVKLGNIGVLTGQAGQIRTKCGSVNH